MKMGREDIAANFPTSSVCLERAEPDAVRREEELQSEWGLRN